MKIFGDLDIGDWILEIRSRRLGIWRSDIGGLDIGDRILEIGYWRFGYWRSDIGD